MSDWCIMVLAISSHGGASEEACSLPRFWKELNLSETLVTNRDFLLQGLAGHLDLQSMTAALQGDCQVRCDCLNAIAIAVQAPLQKYYASLAERSRQQRAMRSAQEVNVGSAADDASDDEGMDAALPSLQEAVVVPAALPAEGLNFKAQMAAGKAARKKAAVEAEREAAAAADAAPPAEVTTSPTMLIVGLKHVLSVVCYCHVCCCSACRHNLSRYLMLPTGMMQLIRSCLPGRWYLHVSQGSQLDPIHLRRTVVRMAATTMCWRTMSFLMRRTGTLRQQPPRTGVGRAPSLSRGGVSRAVRMASQGQRFKLARAEKMLLSMVQNALTGQSTSQSGRSKSRSTSLLLMMLFMQCDNLRHLTCIVPAACWAFTKAMGQCGS